MLAFGLGIRRVPSQWNVEYSSHSGSELYSKNYVAVNTITSGSAVGKKTGCLITADGSEDAKITPEGLADYRVPPSLSYLPACEAEPMSNTPDTTENDEEKQEDLEDLEKPESNGTKFEDCKNDRSEDELCEPKVKGLYENG